MDDHSTDPGPAEHPVQQRTGLTRRQLLQRGAITGGAVLAAQSLGVVAAHAQTSPAPPSGGTGHTGGTVNPKPATRPGTKPGTTPPPRPSGGTNNGSMWQWVLRWLRALLSG